MTRLREGGDDVERAPEQGGRETGQESEGHRRSLAGRDRPRATIPNRSPVRRRGATTRGDVAQLEEHCVRIAGVRGSSPLISTNLTPTTCLDTSCLPRGTRASVNDRQPDPEPEDAPRPTRSSRRTRAEAPLESSTDRRAFMRQMSRDAVPTAGRLAGLSSVVRRSVVAAGVAATRDLEPPAEDALPTDPQPVPNVPAAPATPHGRPAGRPGRRRPAPGTDGRAGSDPDA